MKRVKNMTIVLINMKLLRCVVWSIVVASVILAIGLWFFSGGEEEKKFVPSPCHCPTHSRSEAP